MCVAVSSVSVDLAGLQAANPASIPIITLSFPDGCVMQDAKKKCTDHPDHSLLTEKCEFSGKWNCVFRLFFVRNVAFSVRNDGFCRLR